MSTKTFSSYTNELPDATDLETAVRLVANDNGTVETVTVGALAIRLADLGPIASTESLNATNLNVKNLTSTVTANKTAADKAISDVSKELTTFKATKGVKNGLAPLNDSAKIGESILPMSDLVRLLFFSSFDEVDTVLQNTANYYSTDAGCSVVYNTKTNVLVLAVTVTNTTTYYCDWRDADLFGDATSAGRRPVTGKLYVCTGEDYAYRWNGTDLERLSDLSELQDSIEGHSDAIRNLTSRVEGDETTINTHTTNIATNTANIATLNTRVLELGNFATEDEALAAIKDATISGNNDIVLAHLTYQNAYSITLVQCVENDYCRQVIFNKTRIFHRAIYFSDGTRETISHAEDWAFLLADRLKWDSSANKYVLNQFENNFNAGVTDAIPLATATNDGLMSSASVATIYWAKNKINKLRERSTTKVVVKKCIPPRARKNTFYYFDDGKIRYSFNREYFKFYTLTVFRTGYEYRFPTNNSTLQDELQADGVKTIDSTVFAKYVESKGYDSIIVVEDSGFSSCVAKVNSGASRGALPSVTAHERVPTIPLSSRYQIIDGKVVRRARDIYPRSGRYTTDEMYDLFCTYHFRFKSKRKKNVRGKDNWEMVSFCNVLRRGRNTYPDVEGVSFLWNVRRDKYSPYVQYVLTMVSQSEPRYKLKRV